MLAYKRVLNIVFTAILFSCGASAIALFSVPLVASHGPFTVSSAIYRIPYANGTAVTANNDHHTHPNAVNRVDLAEAMAAPSSPRRRESFAASSTVTETATVSATGSRLTR